MQNKALEDFLLGEGVGKVVLQKGKLPRFKSQLCQFPSFQFMSSQALLPSVCRTGVPISKRIVVQVLGKVIEQCLDIRVSFSHLSFSFLL